jgi:hypothetical protein
VTSKDDQARLVRRQRERKRLVPELLLLALCIGVFVGLKLWHEELATFETKEPLVGVALWLFLIIFFLVRPILFTLRRAPSWKPLPPLRPRVMAIVDTAVACLAMLYLLMTSGHLAVSVLFVVGVLGALYILLPHLPAGLHVAVGELLAFYIGISILDVLTGRAPHERVHPQHTHQGPWEANPYRIRSVGDAIGYFFVMVPTIMSTLVVKASAIVMGPALYLGLSFDATDYGQLTFEARRHWRSSFKTLMLSLGTMSIIFFLAKVFVYVQWNRLASWWNSTPVLQSLDRPLSPAAFLPWHFVLPLQGVLLFALQFQVDSVVHSIDDMNKKPEEFSTKLRLIRAGFRLRTILTVYLMFCIAWLLVPWLERTAFPPITWTFLPQ